MVRATRAGQTVPINDIEMYYETAGEGEPLVLLHGFTGIGSDWDYVFAETPPGYRCILPDLRGHGRSTNSLPDFSFLQSALDILGLLDTLGIERFKAIGVSGGGQTLLHYGDPTTGARGGHRPGQHGTLFSRTGASGDARHDFRKSHRARVQR